MHARKNKYQRYTRERDHISRISFYYASSIKILWLERKDVWIFHLSKSPFDPFANLPKDSMKKENPISIFHLLILDMFTIHSLHSFLREAREREKPIIKSEWLAVQRLIEHEKTFEIVTDKEVSRGIKGNWKIRQQVHKG